MVREYSNGKSWVREIFCICIYDNNMTPMATATRSKPLIVNICTHKYRENGIQTLQFQVTVTDRTNLFDTLCKEISLNEWGEVCRRFKRPAFDEERNEPIVLTGILWYCELEDKWGPPQIVRSINSLKEEMLASTDENFELNVQKLQRSTHAMQQPGSQNLKRSNSVESVGSDIMFSMRTCLQTM